MKELIFGFLFTFLSIAGMSQEIRVLDKKSEEPVKHAQIDILGKRMPSIFTDDQGKATLTRVEISDTLIISHVSYGVKKVAFNSLKKSQQIIYLAEEFISYPSVDITHTREKAVSSPQKVKTLSMDEIKLIAPANAASLLENTGQVMVQRSQQGGGSPIIRGFEANRILLVIDGVRMNNAIYRSGHLQNALSVDNNILESTEIIFGTSSLIYGSDALGGVVHYHSIKPSFRDSNWVSVNTSWKYASAAEENSAHFDFQLRGKRISSLTSFSYADFGDLRMGANRDHDDEEWGLVREYIQTINGVDVVKTSSNPLIQKHSAYDQKDFTQKLRFKLKDKIDLNANFQYSTTTDVPRFDQYNDYRNGTLRYAEWNYGPQNRLLFSVSADISPKSLWADKANFTLAYQRLDEDRITRSFGSEERYSREEDVSVYSFNSDMVKSLKNERKLYYGVEITNNDVQSNAFIENLNTSEIRDGLTRYPNGGSFLNSGAVYISFLNTFKERWQYNAGLRYNMIDAESNFNTNEFFELPFESITINNRALTGSVGLKYDHDENLKLRLLTSSGFRSPNIDDYGKVFDRDGFVVVPDDRLTPEYALNGEFGFVKKLFEKSLQLDASLFYTHILDAIVQRDFTLNGMDSLSLEGEVSRIQSNQNASEARVYGYGIGLKYSFHPNFEFNAFGNYTLGEVIEDGEPLAHIPPFFAKADVAYNNDKINVGLYTFYHDLKSRSSMAAGRTDNPNESLNGQYPSWYTLNVRAAYQITQSVSAQVTLENILDKHYKMFASGISAPGRNFVFVVRATI